MWSKKRAIVKHSAVLASKRSPDGYNKEQLISASKDVFGGYAANPTKEVKTHKQAADYSNYLSEIDGGYPRGLDTCFAVGISGNCGVDCEQFMDGYCDEPDFEIDDIIDCHGEKEGVAIAERYSRFESDIIKKFPLGVSND